MHNPCTGDCRLPNWRKSNVPLLTLPPAGMKLAGWRDPYIVGPPVRHPENGWTMIIGSGIKEQGGTILVYRSNELKRGWKLAGELCSGKQEDGTGIVWECPLMVCLEPLDGRRCPLNHTQQQQCKDGVHCDSQQQNGSHQNGTAAHSNPSQPTLPYRHFFCISPDACTNPTLYYLGNYLEAHEAHGEHIARAATTMEPTHHSPPVHGNNVADASGNGCPKFLLRQALGPFKLDLGDILYAPNTLLDAARGRLLLFAWLQEARKVPGNFSYAGCLCLPRELWLDYTDSPDRPFLIQRPLDEVTYLRRPGRQWTYYSPLALPPRWIQEEAPALSGYRRNPPSQASGVQDGLDTESKTAAAAEQAPPMQPPSSHPLSPEGMRELGVAPSPSSSQPDLRSHPLNPLSHTSLSHSENAEQETARQLDHCAHGEPCQQQPNQESAPHIASPSDPLLLGPGQSFAIPQVEGPFLDVEVVLELFTSAGRPQRTRRHHRQPGPVTQRGRDDQQQQQQGFDQAQQQQSQQGLAADQDASEQERLRHGDVHVHPIDTQELLEEGVRRVSGEHEEALMPPPVGACSGVLLRSWQVGVEGAAAVLYCWDTGELTVVFEALDPDTHEYSLAAPGCRRIGSKLQRPPPLGEPMALRLFVDYSLLEVYTGNGEVLSTRVYRGVGPQGEAGVEVVSVGCCTHLAHVAVYEMSPCFQVPPEQQPPTPHYRSTSDLGEPSSRKQGMVHTGMHVGGEQEGEQQLRTGKKKSEAEEVEEVRQQLRAAALGVEGKQPRTGAGFEDRLLAALGVDLGEGAEISPKRGGPDFSWQQLAAGNDGEQATKELQGVLDRADKD